MSGEVQAAAFSRLAISTEFILLVILIAAPYVGARLDDQSVPRWRNTGRGALGAVSRHVLD